MRRSSYLAAVAGPLQGPRAARARFLTELRDHVDDAVADGVAAGCAVDEAERVALARLGTPAEIAAAWQSYAARRRRENRKRAAVFALAAATASALAVAQHASGLRQPARSCVAVAGQPAHAGAAACERIPNVK